MFVGIANGCIFTSQYKQMSKIKLNREILEAMVFLGIPVINYSQMKQQYGGALQLHAALAEMLGA